MSTVKAVGLGKRFGKVEVLSDISLEIASGEFTVFVGPSGCGKSTWLRCVAGLESISSGTLEINGEKVNGTPPAQRGVAMVFQSYALYPHMTVYGNIAFGLESAGWNKADVRKRVEEAAETLQLGALLDRYPKALSGGQRQRVAIGRAIVRNPGVFLFDEPLSNLDPALRVQMRGEIVSLKRTLPDTTMIYVTHDQVEAMTMADRIVVLNGGRIEQIGAPLELYERPANLFVAGFIGSPQMNFLSGRPAVDRGAHILGIRPEHLEISEAGDGWDVSVTHVERLGSETVVHARSAETGPVALRIARDAAFAPGERLRVAPSPGRMLRFDAEGRRLERP